jgi:hypothetical protein
MVQYQLLQQSDEFWLLPVVLAAEVTKNARDGTEW